MKPQDKAAFDLQPEAIPVVHEPGSERSDSFQPECNHPDFWPGRVMGFDYTGGAKQQPADVEYNRKPMYPNPYVHDQDGDADDMPSHAGGLKTGNY